MRKLLLLLLLPVAAWAQNPKPCTNVVNTAASGQVLSAAAAGSTPPCRWITGGGGGGGGTVTNIATSSPIAGGPITTTGTISCPTCVVGPASVTSGHIATFNGTTGKLIQDGGAPATGTVTSVATTGLITGGPITTTGTIACATCVAGPGTVVSGHLATFNGTSGFLLQDGGVVPGGTVTSIGTTSPITGGTITSTGTIACATCVTSAAALTSTAIMTGAALQASQTPSATTTLDSSGNIVTPGTIQSGSGSGVAGVIDLTQGTLPGSFPANSFSLYAPTSIATSYHWRVPAADAAGGIVSDGSGVLSIKGFSGTGNFCLDTGSACAGGGGGDAAIASIQSGAYVYCVDAAGSGTTYTCSESPALGAYTTGMIVIFKPGTSNTGASTLSINGLGAKSIIAANTTGSALVADDLITGTGNVYVLEYDGTAFRKINGPDGAWTALSYNNSWADFGSSYQVGQYRKLRNGTVEVRGALAAGTLTSGTTIFTMPAGYRPPTKLGTMAAGGNAAGTGYAIGQLDFQTGGTVTQTSNGTLFQAAGPWLITISYSVY